MDTIDSDKLAKLIYFHAGSHCCKSVDDPHINAVFEENTRYRFYAEKYRNTAKAVEDAFIIVDPIELEADAIARILSRGLSMNFDWQHIRAASRAFVKTLTDLNDEKEAYDANQPQQP